MPNTTLKHTKNTHKEIENQLFLMALLNKDAKALCFATLIVMAMVFSSCEAGGSNNLCNHTYMHVYLFYKLCFTLALAIYVYTL
jgi:hypothetical protein